MTGSLLKATSKCKALNLRRFEDRHNFAVDKSIQNARDQMKTNQQDLILKMLDGSEAGQLVPIQVEQCLLGSDPQCAIIRTPDGVQAQCTKGLMLINDVETKVKWLAEGDTVKLGNSTFEIAELGHTLAVESNDQAVDASNSSSADLSNSVNGRIKEFESLLNEQQQLFIQERFKFFDATVNRI